MNNTTKFEAGSTYEHGWINDADSLTQWVIVRRTASTVWAREAGSTGNGAAFRVKINADGYGSSCLRLSFCYPPPDRIREGVRRLAAVLEAEMGLRKTFGATGPLPGLGGHGPAAPDSAPGPAGRSGYDAPGSDVS